MCPNGSKPRASERLNAWCRERWCHHSASIILLSVLIVQTFYCLYTGWRVFPYEYHQQPKPPFWLWYSDRYILSVLADVFGGLVLIWVAKKGSEKGSPATGDD